jgi:hypothetical protein
MSLRVFALALALLWPTAGLADEPAVAVLGPSGQGLTLDRAALDALPRVKVRLEAHGQVHVYAGARLGDVLARVGAPTGAAIHGPAMAQAVRVQGGDGYAVVFGLAELDPGTRPNAIILADEADGAPLAADGPFRLVVEGDLRPARSVRNVVKVETGGFAR